MEGAVLEVADVVVVEDLEIEMYRHWDKVTRVNRAIPMRVVVENISHDPRGNETMVLKTIKTTRTNQFKNMRNRNRIFLGIRVEDEAEDEANEEV